MSCKTDALMPGERGLRIDREKCTACGKCAENCHYNALELAGRIRSVSSIVAEVMKDEVFYRHSGGGVTISGGEPFIQWSFMRVLMEELSSKGIPIAIDTSGFTKWEYLEEAARLADLFLYDLKLIDPEKHVKYTGVNNRLILQNLVKLSDTGARIAIRIPMIRGINDSEKDLNEFAGFISSLRPESVHLLKYHSMGREKYARVNKEYHLTGNEVPDVKVIDTFKEMLKGLGYRVFIGG